MQSLGTDTTSRPASDRAAGLQTGDVRGGRAVGGTVSLTVVRAPVQVPPAGC